ncbi:two-component sensor histidine kinase [Actinomadura sp. NBRC 104425]|uniref:sensor histidine kinase n=1 Tax=Actinomadura sp. NBRC 104425 TaxID=3032204 RepID=UPI0024A44D07|nr:sensor histidine kinase [Actinomadura sp. NBRC 104425]GLZ15134.1 two-component sensor histidine kinase [Actinomadura sp. NBRC 104425]
MRVPEQLQQYAGRWGRRWRGCRADAALAAAVFAVMAAAALAASVRDGSGSSRVPWLGWPLMTAACAALYWRRVRPVTVCTVTLVACAVYYPCTEPDGPLLITFVIALYTVAAEGAVAVAVLLGAAAMAFVAYGEMTSTVNHLQDAALWMLAGWFVAVIAVGGVVRNRRAYLREAERRALAAERGREEEARRRATEERLRIARELHDALGHNISLINVQANAALHGLARAPDGAEAALSAIRQASKDALRELRATLGVLRQVDEAGRETPAEPAAPGLARLDELTGRAGTAGLAVHTSVEGEPRPLPPDTDLAAYRIVQEALTNVTRHSDAASARVRIRYGDDALHVEIEDDGPAAAKPAPGGGTGVDGMRERARALGGELTARARPGGGFRVRARLPLHTDRPAQRPEERSAAS